MTLKEKLEQEKIYINPYNFKLTKEGVENFEKIVDEFAIEFAEWFVNNGVEFYDNTSKGNVYKYLSDLKVYTIKYY